MNLSITSTIKLAAGGQMPRFGLGVYQARGQECGDSVKEALKAGYRHGGLALVINLYRLIEVNNAVDTAQAYRNEDCELSSSTFSYCSLPPRTLIDWL